MSKVYCAKCGKCMTNKDGTSIVGVEINVAVQSVVAKDLVAFTEEQFGRWGLGKYSFCYECVIDSYMGRK